MPVEEQLDLISQQLNILELNQVIAKDDRENILIELKKLKKEPDKFKDYADALSKGLPGVTKGVIALTKLGKDGDPFAISIASLDIFAGVVAMAGPLLGPVGPIVSALSGMISMILGEFMPKPPNLKDQIEELLNKFLAEEKLRDLGAAADQIWILSDTIENHSRNYKSLNLQHGTEIKAIDQAWQWLNQKDKQSVREWDQVLEKTCMVWLQLMRCVALSVAKPSTREGVVKGEMLVYLPARQELFLKYLRLIPPAAQERGLYVMVEGWATFGDVLSVAVGRRGKLPWDYKKNTKWMTSFSMHVSREQLGSPTPRYDIIAWVDNSPKMIVRHQVDSLTGDLHDDQQLMIEGHAYRNNNNSDTRPFVGCVDVWALPDWNNPKLLRVYTAHSAEPENYVNIHTIDSANNVKRVNWEPHTGTGLRHIRALARDISESLPDDPDSVEMPSRMYEIIYGGYRGNSNIWVEVDNDWRDVPSPWDEYNGIEIDQHCLWVFGKKGLACATHASVIKSFQQRKEGKSTAPKWITYKTAWEDGFDVRTLSPCADGILAVGSDQSRQNGLVLWTGDYKINLKEPGKMEWRYNGSPRGGAPKQVQRMPIPCWSLFTQVMRDLEKQVGEAHHG